MRRVVLRGGGGTIGGRGECVLWGYGGGRRRAEIKSGANLDR